MINITYCITVCTELEDITKLINHLHPLIYDDDNILIQYDEGGVSDEVMEYLHVIDKMHDDITVIGYPLNDNFGKFKSNLSNYAKGDYILSIDADEIPNSTMIRSLAAVLENNNVDLIFVPRINTVDGLTQQDAQKWGWKISKLDSQVSEKVLDTDSGEYKLLKKYNLIIDESTLKVKYYTPIINAPDYQSRLYRNTDEVNWYGKVHEKITGYDTFSNFPFEEDWCLYHHKTIERQRKQNSYYDTL